VTRDELIEKLAQDMTESVDLDSLVEFYYESTTCFLDALEEEALLVEYNEWFEEETVESIDNGVIFEEVKP